MSKLSTIVPVMNQSANANAVANDPIAMLMAQMQAMQAAMATIVAERDSLKAAVLAPKAEPVTRIEHDDKGHVIIHGGTRGRFGLKLYPSDFDHLAKIQGDKSLAKALADAIAKARPIADARLAKSAK